MPTRPPTHTALQRKANPLAYARADRTDRTTFYASPQWRRFRKHKLANNPLCEDCVERGITTASREVHHTVRLVDDPTRTYATSDEHTKALCTPCHSRRTQRGE